MIRRIRRAAVLGAGAMGGGIAALMAGAGIKTYLLDIVPPDPTGAPPSDPAARNRLAQAGLKAVLSAQPPLLMARADADLIEIGNLQDDLEKLSDCDWIVEAVVENPAVKQDLFKKVEKVRSEHAIVSTNTSGIPLHLLSTGMGEAFKQHFLGTHFFNPVRYMKLLEIIPAQETLPEIVAFLTGFGEKMLGKGIVTAKDTPNFVGNRIGVQGLIKAMHLMLADGLSIEEADAMLGPILGRPNTAAFRTCDLVGLDILAHVAQNTYEMVREDEAREDFMLPDFVREMIDRKLLGNKTRAGFYKTLVTGDGKKIRQVIDPQTRDYVDCQNPRFPCLEAARQTSSLAQRLKTVVYADDPGGRFAWQCIAHNLIYAANRIPEIADTIVEIDNAVKWGFNFELGPFETWDAIGVAAAVAKMTAEGLVVPEKVLQMLAAGHETFYRIENGRRCYYDFAARVYRQEKISDSVISLARLKPAGVVDSCASASLVDIGQGVFCCEFHTKMNAIDDRVTDFMDKSLDYVNWNGIGLVIGNQAPGTPGAFSAGADIKYLRKLVDEGKFSEIDRLIAKGQAVGRKARYAPFPVVAAPYGLTLGGGCEVCLWADRIVAHAELYMGLVEIGVGLLPAGGGCLNMWKKLSGALPAAVADADPAKCFLATFKNIAMASVSTSAADARSAGYLGACDRIVANRDHLIGEAAREVLKMAADGYVPPVERQLPVFGEAAQGLVHSEIYNMITAGFISEYDGFLARRIAYVISGGRVRTGSRVDEQTLLNLEREVFLDLLKEEKTLARIDHMMATGRPLRN